MTAAKKFERIVNPGTGEIGLFVPTDKGHKIISKEQSDHFKKVLKAEQYKILSRGRNWVACYHDPIKEITNRLKLHELGSIIKLLPYLKFNRDGLLIKNDQPMTLFDIARALKKAKRPTIEIMNALEREEIILKKKFGRNNHYYVNEEFHTMGKVFRNYSFTKLYQVESGYLLEKLTIHEAGMLYKILPYFHYENYYLCANPDEHDPEVIHHLTHEELARLIGEKPKTVYTHMLTLMRYGIVLKLSAFRAVNYLINPDVLFRRESENDYTQEVRKQFQELKRTGERVQ